MASRRSLAILFPTTVLLVGLFACGEDVTTEDPPGTPGPASGSGASSASSGSGASSASSGSGGSGASGGSGGSGSSCVDQVKSGSETDIDCGGACPPCHGGGMCGQDADCLTGLCKDGVCALCKDGVCACGGPGEPCCPAGTPNASPCVSPIECDKTSDTCSLLSGSVTCSGCKTPDQICAEHGFSGASEAQGDWFWQCGGPGECPTGWDGLACADWCTGTDCTGAPHCGGYPVVTQTAAPGATLCATDHGYDCSSYNPGYLVRARCQ